MATSLLSSIPVDNMWSQCDCSYHTYTLHYCSAGNGKTNECHNDPPLPNSFALFWHRKKSPLHLISDLLLYHHMEQENPRTLTTQPTETNVYVMTTFMGVVADGKYTYVLYSCYFTRSQFELQSQTCPRSLNITLVRFVVLAGIRLDKKFLWSCEYI